MSVFGEKAGDTSVFAYRGWLDEELGVVPAPVPEPRTWVLLTIGFIAAGSISRWAFGGLASGGAVRHVIDEVQDAEFHDVETGGCERQKTFLTSNRQQCANRAIAKSSTEPKTPAGKARAARNAFRHGLNVSVLSDPLLCQIANVEGLEWTRCGRCMGASVRATSTLRIAARKVWCLLRLRSLDVREKVCPNAL
jgi:hypothetical protein